MINYKGLSVSLCPDCGDNVGGYYCQVYIDDLEEPIDDFVIHKEDIENETITFVIENYLNFNLKKFCS